MYIYVDTKKHGMRVQSCLDVFRAQRTRHADRVRTAFKNGWPILSFEEFKTKYDVDGALNGRGRDSVSASVVGW